MFQKITADDLTGKGVIGLPDTPELSTAEMQAKFEETAREVIIPALNQLIDDLGKTDAAGQIGAAEGNGLEGDSVQSQLESLLALIQERVKSGDIKAIRVNSDNQLEVSTDGENFEAIGSSGHLIIAPDGSEMPQRGRLKLLNGTVTDDAANNQTVISGIPGPKGDTGAQGDQGIQGPAGKVYIPSVAENGDLTITAARLPTPGTSGGPRGSRGFRGFKASRERPAPRGSRARQATRDPREPPAA